MQSFKILCESKIVTYIVHTPKKNLYQMNVKVGTEFGNSRLVTALTHQAGIDTTEQAAKLYYYHADHLQSAQFITDANGEKYEHIEYTPYGELWIEEVNKPEKTPFRFTGKELDEETGLYYYGARYLDPKYSRWLSGDPAITDYMSGSDAGEGGIYNTVNLSVYHCAGNNPVKYTDPDGKWINFVIGAVTGFLTSTASEVGSRMASGQSFGTALKNTFTDKTSLAVIATSTAISTFTAGVSGAIVTNATKTATLQIAKKGAVSASKIIASNVAKTVAINTASGAIDAGLKDVASKTIKGEKQSISETLQTMEKGGVYAFVTSGLTQFIIGISSTSTSRVPNLLTGTVEDFKIQQPKWAGATGVVGESIIPTAKDMYRSLTQKSELR